MRFLVSLLMLIPVITRLIFFKKNSDVFLPKNIFTIFYVINIAVPTIFLADPSNVENISSIYIKNAISTDSTFYIHIFLQIISYYLVILGMSLRYNKKKKEEENQKNKPYINKEIYKKFGIFFWVIGFGAFIVIIQKVGGFNYFINNLQRRTMMTRDLDLLSWLLPLMSYGCLLIAYSSKKTRLDIKVLIFAAITGFFQGLGGRKIMIVIIIEVIIIFHYTIKNIDIKKILRIKNIIAIFLVYIVFIVVSAFRTPGAVEEFTNNPLDFINRSDDGISSMLLKESYVPYYIFTVDYFKTHDYWMGSSFKGLIYAIIPSSIYPNKPPVDDGTYLYSISLGRTDIKPVMSFRDLDVSSYPLETFGAMYANFGIYGIFFGMILLGIIMGCAYRNIFKSNYSLFSIIIYINIMLNFQLSTLRIFQTIELVIVFGIVTFVAKKIRLNNN